MRTYKRAKLKGGVYFCTVNLTERNNNDLLIANIEFLREAFRLTKQPHPFIIDACVILPEHLHCIWRLPEDDDFSKRWRLIKTHFSNLFCNLQNDLHFANKLLSNQNIHRIINASICN